MRRVIKAVSAGLLSCLLASQSTFAYAPYASQPVVVYGGQVVQIQPTDAVVLAEPAGGQQQVLYLPANPALGQQVIVKDGANNAAFVNEVVFPANGVGTIDGLPSFTLNTNLEAVTLVYDQFGWSVLGISWPASAISPLLPIPNNTVLGNVSGNTAVPVALTRTQLTNLLNLPASTPIPSNTLLGNISASTALPIAITVPQLTALPNLATTALQGMSPPATAGQLAIGQLAGSISAQTISGDLTLAPTGVMTLATVTTAGSCTNCSATVNAKGLVTSFSSGSPPFGGDGSNGAITGSLTYATPTQLNATVVNVDGTHSITITAGSPLIINSQSTITIVGTVSSTAGEGSTPGAGNTGGRELYMAGSGPGGGGCGVGSAAATNGGGGGGCGGHGGIGGAYASTSVFPYTPGGSIYYSWLGGGSGGGYGGGTSGWGGAGGACVILCAVGAISISPAGSVSARGEDGHAPVSGSGGGGGSGGIVWLISQTSCSSTGTLSVPGGNGGAGATNGGGGGGGGGGQIYLWSPSNTRTDTENIAGGAGGSGPGSGSNGNGGASGASTLITGTPNLPLLTWVGLHSPTTVAEARTYGDGAKWLQTQPKSDITGREMARAYAHGDLDLYAKALTPGFDSQAPTCLNNDVPEVLKGIS